MRKWSHFGRLFLRVSFSLLLIPFGIEQLDLLMSAGTNATFLAQTGVSAIALLFLGITACLICPLLIMLGIRSRIVAIFPATVLFTLALLSAFSATVTLEENLFVYFIGMVTIIILGDGKYAMIPDHRFQDFFGRKTYNRSRKVRTVTKKRTELTA